MPENLFEEWILEKVKGALGWSASPRNEGYIQGTLQSVEDLEKVPGIDTSKTEAMKGPLSF